MIANHGLGWFALALLTVFCTSFAMGQQTTPSSVRDEEEPSSCSRQPIEDHFREFGAEALQGQERIWSAPLHFRVRDSIWVGPLAGVTAGLIAFDKDIEKHVDGSQARTSQRVGDAAVVAELGTAGLFCILGTARDAPHARETGVLSYQAAVASLIVSSALQGITGRARPDDVPAGGSFWAGGSSFPSDHATVAWSIASVVAHEYPGWATQLLAYGTATTVSVSRITGRKHFASDVFVGSSLGWLIGRGTFLVHQDRVLPGTTWNELPRKVERVRDPIRQASPYVPVDSWVYAAVDRLSALGYAPSGLQNLRPWTRLEFADLLQQAALAQPSASEEVGTLYRDLQAEFAADELVLQGGPNVRASIDAVYNRVTTMAGPPLTDGLHFGQTLINDYGRPYQRGLNNFTGFSTEAEAGSFTFHVSGEYQHSPAAASPSDSVRSAIASSDGLPAIPASGYSGTNQFRLLDSYIALNLGGWQASFGKQSAWWGPDTGGDLMFSDNAEPITMLRLNRVLPFKLPGVLRILGRVQSDSFLGQLAGYNFLRLGPSFVVTGSYEHPIDPQPYIWGQKFAFQVTSNLQLGVSVTTVFAGLGRPLTLDTFLQTFSLNGNAQRTEPGDRRTGFDFSYRIPGLRRWLILYNAALSEDELNPIAYPRRSAMNPGVYFPQIPGLHGVDLHGEAVYTDLPSDPRRAVFYTNMHYVGGYTNNGQIIGSWVGPEARGYQLWANDWRSGQNKIQIGYRRQTVDPSYIGGGHLQDINGTYEFLLRSGLRVKAGMQYERWSFPVLADAPKSNLALSLQFTYHAPRLSTEKR